MSDTITGTTVADRYQITGYLRAGRMGDIYVARRLEDGVRVSIKLLDPELFYNPEAVKRFARESRIARSITHAASMQVLDVGRDEIGPYMVMEFVEGEFVSDLLAERGRLDPARAARITARVALALEAAHAAGVVHRDLASANVLVASQGSEEDIVKVTDFGLSQLTGLGAGSEEELTAVGVRIGTPSNMAPEYIEDYELDHRADIYGLGVMLYEMLTGELPFVGRPYAVLEQHVSADRPRPSAKVPEVPTWLDDLVVQMMAIEPAHRVQSAREVVTLIELGLGTSVEAARYVAPTGEPVARELAPNAAPASAPAGVAARPPAGSPDRAEPARLLDALIASHLRGAHHADVVPPPSRTFVIARVARTSVAASIGVSPGWRVYLPDEDPGQGLLDPALPGSVDERRYVFLPPGGGDALGARTTGLDLGMQLLRSPENVAEAFDPTDPDPDALLDLWRQARWELLEDLALQAIAGSREGPQHAKTHGLAEFLASGEARRVDHPALALLGAALYEQDERGAGLQLTERYQARYREGWPSVFDAIAELYAGLGRLEASDPVAAAGHFEHAARTGWLARAVARYQEITRRPLDLTPLVGHPFPDGVLGTPPTGGEPLTVAGEVARLAAPQLLTLCVLGPEGGNTDYDAFMRRYMRLAGHLGTHFARLVVVTSAPQGSLEAGPAAEGVDVEIVHDERASLHRVVQPGSHPTVLVLDHASRCLHQGVLTSCDAWDAMAYAERLA